MHRSIARWLVKYRIMDISGAATIAIVLIPSIFSGGYNKLAAQWAVLAGALIIVMVQAVSIFCIDSRLARSARFWYMLPMITVLIHYAIFYAVMLLAPLFNYTIPHAAPWATARSWHFILALFIKERTLLQRCKDGHNA